MGLLDNLISRLATEIQKAAPIATPISPLNNQQGIGTSVPLERDPNLARVPFAPGLPIIPSAINPVRADGRPDPRRYEFQVAQNINITETRLVPFKTLRASADQIDILRRCVEVMKQKMTGLEWDIVLTDDSTEKVVSETGLSPLRAQQVAKEKFSPEINRLRQFWRTPDPSNGLIFADWLNMALEDVLVLDAWAVWPQRTVGQDLHGLQILDGSTIKPLLDDRGMRPLAPNAAFQQILFGFPRSEFSAPDETPAADGEFTQDELSYMVRNRRSMSVYGYSPVERALPLADIYLRRQQWLRAEYTDGVLPDLMFKTDATFGNNPDLLRAYENVFNDNLAGQTEQRRKGVLLPAGVDPVQFDGYGEKFKDALDKYLVNSICGHFGVMPSEIGFNPDSGLGGAGFQDGEASSSELVGLVPLARWMGRMLSHLSYVFLGMPRELEFKFMPSVRSDDEATARAEDIRLKNGSLAINEVRANMGYPLLEAEEADTPIFLTTTGGYFVTENGMMDVATGSLVDATDEEVQPDELAPGEVQPSPEEPAPASEAAEPAPVAPTEEESDEEEPDDSEEEDEEDEDAKKDKAAVEEIRQFIRWVRKSPSRPFEFSALPESFARTLNKFVEARDFDGARWYAERYL